MTAIFVSTDLVFISRVSAAAKEGGFDVQNKSSVGAIKPNANGQVRLVILDLSTPRLKVAEAVPRLKALDQPPVVVAYAPHVMADRLEEARQAGCDDVFTRGQFDHRLSAILRRYLES